MKVPRYVHCIDLARFNLWARIIDKDQRTTENEKMIFKLKAWRHYVSTKSFHSIMMDLPVPHYGRR